MKKPYSDRRWGPLRASRFEHDGGICQDCGKLVTLEKNQPNTMHLAHVKDWRQFPLLAFEFGNVKTSCGGCNSSESARRKAKNGHLVSDTNVFLVTGDGGSRIGYVIEHAGPDDMIIDYDTIKGGLPGADHRAVNSQRSMMINLARKGETGCPNVWITAADASKYEWIENVVDLDDSNPMNLQEL